MAICNSACAPSLPVSYTGNGCSIIQAPGGIKIFTFVKCDYTFTDISDTEEWIAAITANDAVLSGYVLAQKPKGTFTKKRIASCQPEAVSGAEKTITFQDYNTDTVTAAPGPFCAAHVFWNTFLTNPGGYKFGYWTCDNQFYGLINDIQVEIDEVIEDNNTGSRFFDGTILWNDITMICPTPLNIDTIINGL
jgi:hypothetical protein